MPRFRCLPLLTLGLLWTACSSNPAPVTEPRAAGAKRFQILQINDVYKIEGLEGGAVGGLARVRTLRTDLEKNGPVFLLHGGDLLFPSVMSKQFQAQAMVEGLNLLDGSPGFDDRLIVTFGNHEFDQRTPDILKARLPESRFHWITSNVYYRDSADARPEPFHRRFPNVRSTIVRDVAGIRIGFFGLTLDDAPQDYVFYDYALDPAKPEPSARNAAIRATLSHLEDQDVDVIIAVTHQNLAEDVRLAQDFPEIDLIVGGHEHIHNEQRVGNTLITKADSDAKTAYVIEVDASGSGAPQVQARLVPLDSTVAKDPAMQAAVDGWTDKLAQAIPDYNEVYGTTANLLEGEEPAVRGHETALGNWLADVVRERMATDVAFIQGGSIRINDNIPAGSEIRGEHLAGIFYYDSTLYSFELTGQQLLDILSNSVSLADSGAGRFLQVSNLRFEYKPAGTGFEVTRAEVKRAGAAGYEPIDPNATYTATTLDYLWRNGSREDFAIFSLGAGGQSPTPINGTGEAKISWRKITEEWLERNSQVTTVTEGRIVRNPG